MKNIAFIIFLLFISICRAQDNNILFQNYNVSNGLSQNTVIRSLEDSNGVMWFCTRDGLNRFDGTEFEVFRADGQPHSLSSSDVTTIIEESMDRDSQWTESLRCILKYIHSILS